MRQKRETCPYQKLSVEQLDTLLQAELEKEMPEEGVVLPILRELEKRENQPTETCIAAARKKQRSRFYWTTGTVAAAILCVVLLFWPQTVGAQSLFDAFVHWTKDVFFFSDPEKEPKTPKTVDFSTDHPGLQQLYDKVTEQGVTIPVVPAWLPEGFTLTEIKQTPVPEGLKIYAMFLGEAATITFTYRVYSDSAVPQYEKKDIEVEVFDVNGAKHYILLNDGKISVAWLNNNIECLITADIEKDAVYEIIRSIYRRNIA